MDSSMTETWGVNCQFRGVVFLKCCVTKGLCHSGVHDGGGGNTHEGYDDDGDDYDDGIDDNDDDGLLSV